MRFRHVAREPPRPARYVVSAIVGGPDEGRPGWRGGGA